MSAPQPELAIIQNLVPELEAEGYEVYIQPSRHLVPDFLQDYQPDAIALRADKSLVIELVRPSNEGADQTARIAGLLKGRKDWALRIVWVTPASLPEEVASPGPEVIRKRIDEVRELANSGHLTSALLLAWAAFEAIGRRLVPEDLQHRQTPERLVETLSNKGYVTPSEGDSLRSLAKMRNRFAHGDLKMRVTKPDIEEMLKILDVTAKLMGQRKKRNGTCD